MTYTLLDILNIIWSAVFMLIFFGLCIFIHELGHFLAGRLCGLHVVAFSIGFRKIWSKKIGGVEYRIGWIPVGGYVDLPQIDSTGNAVDENGNPLPKAEPWKRIVTAFAGPFFNILFGLALGCLIWWYGIPQETPRMSEFQVQSVEEGSPEWNAGLRKNDVIVKFNGKNFSRTWTEFARDIMLNIGDVDLEVIAEDGTVKHVVYKPVVNKNVAPRDEIPYPFFTPEIPVIVYAEENSPAAQAGIQKGDRITHVNGKPIYGADELILLCTYSHGKPLEMVLDRNGEALTVKVQPEPYPDIESEEMPYQIGVEFNSSKGPLYVEHILPGMPCENILFPGDRILALDGVPMESNSQFTEKVRASEGKTLVLTVKRGDKFMHVNITPVRVVPQYTGLGFSFRIYPDPFQQFANVLQLTWQSLKSVSAGVGRTLGFDSGYTTLGPKHFSGPIGIGRGLFMSVYSGGFMMGINLVILISFSLGLFNLLPMPVLDGGHILLAVLEIIFRRPVSEKVLTPITYAFVFILIAFMIFVSFYDVKKLIPVSSGSGGTGNHISGESVERIIQVEKALRSKEAELKKSAGSVSSGDDSSSMTVEVLYQDVFPKTDKAD